MATPQMALRPAPETSAVADVWAHLQDVPCELTVEIPAPQFKLADWLGLGPGSIVNTHWAVGREIPLQVNGVVVGWSEFDVSAGHLAVRLTELA